MRFTRPGDGATRRVVRNESADVRLIGLVDIKPTPRRRRLLISSGRRAHKVLSSFADNERATEFIGVLDDSPDFEDNAKLLGVPHMGHVEALTSVLDTNIVDQVIVALPPTRFHPICRIVWLEDVLRRIADHPASRHRRCSLNISSRRPSPDGYSVR